MAVVVEELVVRLSADLKRYDAELARIQGDTDRRLAAIERRYQGFTNSLNNSVSRFSSQAQTALAGVGLSLGVAELVAYADTWTRVGRSLESTAQVFGVATLSAKELAQIAVETRSDLEATVTLYNRTAVAAAKLGLGTQVAADVTATFSKALKLGQASATEQASAMLQFSQALQKGKLDGDEFRSVMENAGVVQQALTEKFQVSSGTLFKMAETGKLTAKDLIAALQSIKGKVDTAFANAPTTVAEAFTNLKTRVVEYFGTVNQAAGATGGLAAALNGLASNIDNVARVAAIAGAALLAAYGPSLIAAIGGAAVALGGAAAALGVVGVGAVALAGAGAGVMAFGDQIALTADKGILLQDVVSALATTSGNGLSGAFATASGYLADLATGLSDIISGVPVSLDAVQGAIRTALNGIVGSLMAAYNVLSGTLIAVFTAIPEALVGALNTALANIATFARNAASLLNSIPGVTINIDAIKLPELSNGMAGSAALAQEAWARATRAMTRDYVAEWTAAASDAAKPIADRAAEAAELRREKAQGEEALRRSNQVENLKRKPTTFANEPEENKYTKEINGIKKRTDALVAEIGAIGRSTAAQETAKAKQELLTKAREAELKITPQLRANIDKLATAYGDAAAKLELLQQFQRVREESSSIEREIALTGLYGFELQKARVEAQLLADARKAGITLGPDELAEVERLAARNAALKQLNETIGEVRDTSRTALKSFITDLREGQSGAEALGGALNKIGDKLIDMAANQLVEAALGGLIGGGAGSALKGGGSLLSLFGFADGGIMVPGSGPRDLPKFAGGGVSNRAAIFGEAGPEAAVPLPDGRRIPVDLRLPAQPTNVSAASATGNVAVNLSIPLHLSGSVSAADLAAVRREVLSAIPGAVQQGVSVAFDRNPRFRRSGL